MKKSILRFLLILCGLQLFAVSSADKNNNSQTGETKMISFASDSFKIKDKELKIYFIGHGTLLMDYAGKIIHIDPVSAEADYSELPAADLILITHQHGDHLDPATVKKITKSSTIIIADGESAKKLEDAQVMKNGDTKTVIGIGIEAVPAYNTTAGRSNFHPKGRDNGYILNFDGFRVYVAGDTEDTPEMKALKNIDVAFLPMNQPYTMLPEQVAAAARAIKPAVLYPYHYGDTDTAQLVRLLKDDKDIDVRIRELQ